MLNQQSIILVYQFLYSKKYNNKDYKLILTDRNKKYLENFIKTINTKYNSTSIGNHYLLNYFLFHFNRIENLVFNRFATKKDDVVVVSGRVQLQDIISKKSIDLFLNRDKRFDYKIKYSNFLKKYKISYQELYNHITDGSDSFYNISEENERLRFFNTDEGLYNCITRTTMFSLLSKHCEKCNFLKPCIKIKNRNK